MSSVDFPSLAGQFRDVRRDVDVLKRLGDDGWTPFEEPFDNDWENYGGTAEPWAWKLNPSPGKAPFLRGSIKNGTSGTSPKTLPTDAGAPFDGDTFYLVTSPDANLLLTKIDVDGVITVTEIVVAGGISEDDFNDLSDALAAHLADTSGAHPASAISVVDSGGNYTASTVEGVLAEIAGIIDAGLSAAAEDISVADPGNIFAATDVEAALAELYDALAFHLADTTDAHDASAISVAAGSTTVEAALGVLTAALAAHIADAVAAHAATAVSFSPAGSVSSTTVQAAIEEVASEGTPGADGPTGPAGFTLIGLG